MFSYCQGQSAVLLTSGNHKLKTCVAMKDGILDIQECKLSMSALSMEVDCPAIL